MEESHIHHHYIPPASASSTVAYARRPRHTSSSSYGRAAARLPHLRLDATLVLIGICFTMGVYLSSFVGMSRTVDSLGGGGGALFSKGVDLPALQAQVQTLTTRMTEAETEAALVLEENQKLRLDNKVEQSNLKTLTKAKNEEIRGLKARIEEVEKKVSAGGQAQQQGGGGVDKEELRKARERAQALEKELNDLHAQLELAMKGKPPREPLKKASVPPPPPPPQAPQQQQQQQQQKAKSDKPLMTRKTVSIPEPQPFNPYWETRLQELFGLAQSDPASLLSKLDDPENDPLSVNIASPQDFSCPSPEQRLTQPDLRRMEIAAQFRGGQGFVFFQHLRKAGGTGFCDLATRNMPGQVPPYYCMADERGTLATPPWNTSWLLDTMEKKQWRIAANEWDPFLRSKFAIGDAVFATTLRDPTDRWYSQYRFEHLEHRDGSPEGETPQPFDQWYSRETMGNMGENYYLKTFLGEENPVDEQALEKKGRDGVPLVHGNFYWGYHKYRKRVFEWTDFNVAVDSLRRFHAVLVLEWLKESDRMIEEIFGWAQAPRQVLPHEVQAVRSEKKSKCARDLLEEGVFEKVREGNVLDHLFYAVARRVFLERYTCGGGLGFR